MFLAIRLYCFILLALGFSVEQESLLGGLRFHGGEQPIDLRTSYNVFGDKTVEFSDSFTIEFELALYPEQPIGYIFRVKNRNSDKVYNLFYDGQGANIAFRLNEEGKDMLVEAIMNKEELLNSRWFAMKATFDLKSDSIGLLINNKAFGAANVPLPDRYSPEVLFGKSDHIIDVPSFAIKNLAVGNRKEYYFELKEIEGQVVHDVHGKEYGFAINPEWLMNDAYRWRHKATFRSRSVAGSNYNPERKEVYYFNRDTLLVYNVWNGETRTEVFDERCPVALMLGTNFLDTVNGKLYAYEVYYPSDFKDNQGPMMASLDLRSLEWTPEHYQRLPTQLHHHGSFFDPDTRRYTIFGGFGNMRYSGNFFSYNLDERVWEKLEEFEGDVITPRYFSSVGYLKRENAVYIFGGMGNESGQQIVGRKYYYDLYRVDLNARRIEKLWEIPWKKDNMVPVRGMVILDDSCFYTLCYPEHFSESKLQLFRFSLKDGSYEILGDSIPIYSDKITTNANLYYDSDLNNLYAIVQEFEDDISSDLKIYSLAFPPISANELASYARKKNAYVWWAVILLCGVLAAGFAVWMRRSAGRKTEGEAVELPVEVHEKPGKPTRANAVYLFGEFMARDRRNRDITHMFSAQLKQIFCVILQGSQGDGVSSQKLTEIFWPDRPADKAKNSRGVSINHLRKALSEIDGIELIYEKGHFKIVYTGEFYCDCLRCLEILSSGDIEDNRRELLDILSRGKFLQSADHPAYDSFKAELEKKLEPALLVEIEKAFEDESYQTVIELADAVFHIDPLNDLALAFQVRAMQKLKMNEKAKLRYQTFVVEYRNTMGSEYPNPMKI